jgi:hypothetical protein
MVLILEPTVEIMSFSSGRFQSVIKTHLVQQTLRELLGPLILSRSLGMSKESIQRESMELTSMESTLLQMDSCLPLEMITVLFASGETLVVSAVNQDATEVTLSMLSVSNSAQVETDSSLLVDMIRQSCNTRLCEHSNLMDGN